MKVLILGGDGMIGNGIKNALAGSFETACTSRRASEPAASAKALWKTYGRVDVLAHGALEHVFADFQPEYVINCVGLVKQKYSDDSAAAAIELNALFPYRLSEYCKMANSRLMLMSTDCVFSGATGNYTEEDVPDATDNYGRTKILGEIAHQSHVLTLRTSTIGLELFSNKGLVEWYLQQKDKVRGYSGAIYTGFTMTAFGEILKLILSDYRTLSGLYHVSSEKISKFSLLSLLRHALGGSSAEIDEETQFQCDRSLDSSRFRNLTGFSPPSWQAMIHVLAEEIKNRRLAKK